jgi:hypothetical protein
VTTLAKDARFERSSILGDAVAVAGGFLPLAETMVPDGKIGLFNLVQSVRVNPSTTVLDRQVAGLTWRARVKDPQGNARNLNLDPNAGLIRWTFTDGTPVAVNVLVLPTYTLEWGAVVDAATLPATVTHLAGGIVGWLFNADTFTEDQLLGLVSTP